MKSDVWAKMFFSVIALSLASLSSDKLYGLLVAEAWASGEDWTCERFPKISRKSVPDLQAFLNLHAAAQAIVVDQSQGGGEITFPEVIVVCGR